MAVLSETFGENGEPAGSVVHRTNVLMVNSKTPADGAEVRIGTPAGEGSEILGFLGFDRLQAENRRQLKVQLVGKCRPDGSAYVELYCQRAFHDGDMGENEIVAVFGNGPAPVPSGGGRALPNEFHHPNGVVWFVVQEDGNVVVYQNKVQYVPDTMHPIYWTGSQITPGYTEPRERPTPPAPPSPPHVEDPPDVQGVRVIYKTFNEIVRAGDFDRLTAIFSPAHEPVTLDASDIQAYHDGRLSWNEVIDKYHRKVGDDNVSR